MIRRNLHFVLMVSAMFVCSFASAQLYIDNAQFFIQAGATVTVQGDVTSNADIQGTGKLLLKGSGNQNVSMSGKTIPMLEVDNVANATLTTSARVDSLLFTNGDILLGANNLSLGTGKQVGNASSTRFVVTNSTGKLIKTALGPTAFTYPVGNTTSSYNPVSIANSGTVDSIGVRCLANALTQGTAGVAITKEVVDASWDISEQNAGGSSLAITANWATSDQLTGFDIAKKTGLSYYVTSGSIGWDLLNSQTAIASAGTPNYSVTRSGVASLGTFAIGQRPVLSPLLVAPKIFLQGPSFNAAAVPPQMGDGLRSIAVTSGGTTDATHGVIPLTEPYSAAPLTTFFTHSGSGGGETTTSAVLSVTGSAAIVDWVFVQLHDGTQVGNPVVSTRAGLLRRDGQIVETDGVTPLNMAGNAQGSSYYISVRQRNHLGARTLNTVNLSGAKTASVAYDFTAAGQAFGAGAPMASVSAGIYGLYGGNANSDISTKKVGTAATNDYSLFLTSVNSVAAPGPSGVYKREDFNMDGNVRKTGTAATNDYSKFLSILGTNTTITQPTF